MIRKMFKIILIFIFSFSVLFAESNFSGERLEKSCLEFIRGQIDSECKIDFLVNVPDKIFSQNGLRATIQFAGPKYGLSKIKMIFKNSNEIYGELDIAVRISVLRQVPTANKKMRAGDKLTAQDIEFKKILSENAKQNVDLIINRQLRRSLDVGDIIGEDILKPLVIIQKGENVKIDVYSGKIKITSMGTALNDASVGEAVRVQRSGGASIIHGTAFASGLVVISN
jgi:flagella basal body P-ring formation protein FlgA